MALFKNTASQKIAVYAHDTSADAAKTGDASNITAQISLDFGTAASTNDTNPTELDSADHPGVYVFDLTQAETNAEAIVISAVSATADISIEPIQVFTTPPTVDANVTQISGDSTAADNCEAFFDGTGYAGTNNIIPTVTTLTGHTPQTGDSYARLGLPSGASVSADIAALNIPTAAQNAGAVWDELQTEHQTTGTFGDYLDTEVSGVGGGGGSTVNVTTESTNIISESP